MLQYSDFLNTKRLVVSATGPKIARRDVHSSLFEFQRDITAWSTRKGRSAIFADTGLGKTRMQLEWARLIGQRTLILAPLTIARQTVKEAELIGISVRYVRDQSEVTTGLSITNYEMLSHFEPDKFGAVVLDESSILKSMASKTRQKLIDAFGKTPYRLACTATPAPNDIAEIANHAEFLGVMSRSEMLAAFFVHDDAGWRLKKHAEDAFYQWLASWGMSVRRPSDLGYSDDGYNLPKLTITPEYVTSGYKPNDQLFFTELKGVQDRAKVRKATASLRVEHAASLAIKSTDQWIMWCGLNDEANKLAKAIPDSINVEGKMTPEAKQAAIEDFQDGKFRVLVTKPDIAGFGINFQNAHNMAFVGIGDSFETYYQCIRREYRFGQQHPVNVHVVLSDVEQGIYQNVLRKETESNRMSDELVKHIKEFEKAELVGSYKQDIFTPTLEMKLPIWLKKGA